MSMWSSHIPNLDFKTALPVLCGRETDGVESGQPGEGGTGAGEQKSTEQSAGTGEKDGGSEGNPQAKITAQEEIIARKQQQLTEKETELEELRKFKSKAEQAKLTDQEKIDLRIKELEESNSAKDKTLQKLVQKNAFISANDVAWHDPETALSLIDLSSFEIVVDENTGIPSIKDQKGFAEAIAKLAKDKPFLVKTPSTEGDKPGAQAWTGSTGTPPKAKESADASERERLKKKFPALRGR